MAFIFFEYTIIKEEFMKAIEHFNENGQTVQKVIEELLLEYYKDNLIK